MIRTQVFSFPVFGRKKRRRRPIYHSSGDDDIWDVDPDDKRRVNENKNWRNIWLEFKLFKLYPKNLNHIAKIQILEK